ncbi:hypothetical protein M0Q28_04645 [Patescibacteria group bacterium]|nr:hypothetical protein [Patescibacteria group bacterium]
MTDQQQPEEPQILKELRELDGRMTRGDLYQLDHGKWNDAEVIGYLTTRKVAVEKTLEAIRQGHNNHPTVASMLAFFRIDPNHPRF